MFKMKLIVPLIFAKNTFRQDNFVYPQLRTWQPNMIFQLDGATAHWELDVRAFLNAEFTNRWIGRDGPTL